MSTKDDKSEAGSGGVRHDARGNAVWHWAVDTGKHALDSTSRLLKRLEVPGLKLEGDTGERKAQAKAAAKTPAARGAAQSNPEPSKSGRQTGYNPYGGAPGGRPASAGARPGAAMKPGVATKPAAKTATRPSFWQRLFRKN